jgi:hypothetical protein
MSRARQTPATFWLAILICDISLLAGSGVFQLHAAIPPLWWKMPVHEPHPNGDLSVVEVGPCVGRDTVIAAILGDEGLKIGQRWHGAAFPLMRLKTEAPPYGTVRI